MVFTWLNNTLDEVGSQISLYSMVLLSLIFAAVIVFVATQKFTIASGAVTVLIAGLIYLLASSAYGSGLNISVPSVGYPIPPRLGLDGISLANIYPDTVREPTAHTSSY